MKDSAIILGDHVVGLDTDELRNQMTAQVHATRISFTSWTTWQLISILFVAYCTSWGTGFDSSLSSAMNSNSRWHADLKIPSDGSKLGIVTAIYTIGNLAGSLIAGPCADRYGRRIGMFLGSIVTIIGAIVMATSHTSGAYMGGRFLTGFGIAIFRSSGPALVTELAPPQWRGPATLLYNSLWLIGAILASSIAFGTGHLKTSFSWRIPLYLQVVPSSIVLFSSLLLPESPRWLVANDRMEDAKRILTKYHGNGDENSPLVSLELAEMHASIKMEASDKRWYDFSELFSSKSARYRSFLVLSMSFIGQWGGSNLTTYYLANLLKSLGIHGSPRLLTYNMAYYVSCLGGATVGSLLCDKVGRRKLLMMGCIAMCACLVSLSALTSQFHTGQSGDLSRLTIAFIFFVGIFHSGGINPLVVAYPVECLHTNTRAKGMAMNGFFLNVAEFVNTYGTPIALKKIKWKIYIIYAVWNVVQTLWIYIFFVETRGRTLEELDPIFESDHPVRASLKKADKVEAVSADDVKVLDV